MNLLKFKNLLGVLLLSCFIAQSQDKLSLESIYASSKYSSDSQSQVFWISEGDAYITVASNSDGESQLIKHRSKDNKSSVFLSADALTPEGTTKALDVEAFRLSQDQTKV